MNIFLGEDFKKYVYLKYNLQAINSKTNVKEIELVMRANLKSSPKIQRKNKNKKKMMKKKMRDMRVTAK